MSAWIPLGENYREYKSPEIFGKLPPGPWHDEPDKAQWIDPATGLDCLIVRNHHGSLCGYVGVPEGHRWFGQKYDDPDVSVHGGLTFANRCQRDAEAHGICHVPAPGRPDHVWWFGFDTGHFMDLMPTMLNLREQYGLSRLDDLEVYRDWAYVVGEVTDLAKQLAESPR